MGYMGTEKTDGVRSFEGLTVVNTMKKPEQNNFYYQTLKNKRAVKYFAMLNLCRSAAHINRTFKAC
jgi:hypothetical protein